MSLVAQQLKNVALLIEALEKMDLATSEAEDCYLDSPIKVHSSDGEVGHVYRVDAGIWNFRSAQP